MKPFLPLCLALAALALSACDDPAPPPPPSPGNVIADPWPGLRPEVGGSCRYVNLLARAAQRAGVDVERSDPIVQAAIRGLSHDLPCGLVEDHAVDALTAAATRDPSLRREPGAFDDALKAAQGVFRRSASRICAALPRFC